MLNVGTDERGQQIAEVIVEAGVVSHSDGRMT